MDPIDPAQEFANADPIELERCFGRPDHSSNAVYVPYLSRKGRSADFPMANYLIPWGRATESVNWPPWPRLSRCSELRPSDL